MFSGVPRMVLLVVAAHPATVPTTPNDISQVMQTWEGVVAFGTAAGAVGSTVVGAAAAVLVLGALGGLTYRLVARIPRRALQLFVGAILTTFGIFWVGEGLGVAWPGDQSALLALGAVYVVAALGLLSWVRHWRRDTTQWTAQPQSASTPSPSGMHR